MLVLGEPRVHSTVSDPMRALRFIPSSWTVVRAMVQVLLLLPLTVGPQMVLFEAEKRINPVEAATAVFFGGGVALFVGGWWRRRKVSQLAGTVLMFGSAAHVVAWSLLLALL